MRILFITDNFPPETNAPATRTYEHCKEWVALGAKVTVITCAPNFPQGKVYNNFENQLLQKEYKDGIKVIRVWSYITANKGFIKRTVDYLSFAFSSLWAGLFLKTDIIVATSPQFFTTWSAFILSKIKRKSWVFELRDLWPESIRAVGAMKNELILKILEKIELFLYRDADVIIPNTKAFRTNLVDRGITNKKIHVIPNGINSDLFYPRPKDQALLQQLELNNKFVVGYLGTHGLAHALDFVLDTASLIEDKKIHFLFVGDGAEKKNMLKQVEELSLKNVTFLDPIPKNEVPRYLSIFDVSLVPLKKSDTFKTVIPSKIFEAAAMGIPILLGVEGQAKEIVEKYRAGRCFEPENKADFINVLNSLKSDTNLYNNISTDSLNLAKAYKRKELAKKMLEILRNLK